MPDRKICSHCRESKPPESSAAIAAAGTAITTTAKSARRSCRVLRPGEHEFLGSDCREEIDGGPCPRCKQALEVLKGDANETAKIQESKPIMVKNQASGNDLGRHIKSVRKRAGLTQRQLAEQVGVSNVAICYWERGRCVPSMGVFARLCQALGAEPNELLALEGEKNGGK